MDWKKYATQYIVVHNIRNEIFREIKLAQKSSNKKKIGDVLIPKYFALVVDVILAAELSVELAQLIINHPSEAKKIFIEALEDIISNDLISMNIPNQLFPSQTENTESYRRYQMHISFQLKGIPSVLFHTSHHIAAQSQTYHGLLAFKGVLISLTQFSMYKRSCVYSCSNSDCTESNKRRISTYVGNDPQKCNLCSSNVIEHTDERDIGRMIKGILIPKSTACEEERSHPNHHFQHGIVTRFYDSLATNLKLGEEYEVAGCMGSRGLNAYYIHKSSPLATINTLHWLKQDGILYLKDKLEDSPWAFFVALASQLTSDDYPNASFLHLKRGLLLSLLSLASKSQPIHVLAVGSENLPAQRLMLNAASLASRNVMHTVQQSVTAKSRWQEETFGGNTLWLDAGSLFLAQGGVCYAGDWEKYRKDAQSEILVAIEKKQISIKFEKKASMTEQLQCAIWCHTTTRTAVKLRPLIDVFGIVFITDLSLEEEENVIDKLLYNSSCDSLINEKEIICMEELGMFTQTMASKEVHLDPRAAQLIQDYFVASRRCRGLSNPDECLPIGAVDSIKQMAQAHARLSMRSTVTCEDSLAVICLCEEALTALYGQSFISNFLPLQVKTTATDSSEFMHEVDSYMKQFSNWIERFLKDLVGNTTCSLQREE